VPGIRLGWGIVWVLSALSQSPAAAQVGIEAASAARRTGASQHVAEPRNDPRQQQADLLDLNTASFDQLRTLPGMGPAYARRVIAARPYTAKNQLLTRGVLPQAAYQLIRDRIVAHRATAPVAAQ
jgi:competence protein ComEA